MLLASQSQLSISGNSRVVQSAISLSLGLPGFTNDGRKSSGCVGIHSTPKESIPPSNLQAKQSGIMSG